MKKILVTLLLCLVTLPTLAQNTILIVGDSISAGYGIDLKQGWAALLQARLKEDNYPYRVINASISGDTTSDGLGRLPKVLSQYKPEVTIIELGGNDGLRGLPLSVTRHNLQSMITLAKNARTKVLLLGIRLPPNYGETYISQFQQIFPALAKANTISVVPLFLKGVDADPALMQADGIHPAAKAQVILLNNVWPELQKLLK